MAQLHPLQQSTTQPRPSVIRPSNKALWISLSLGIAAALANMAFVSTVQGSRLSVLKANSRLVIGKRVTSNDFTPIQIYGDDLKQMKALVVEAKDLTAFSQVPIAETLEPGQLLLQSSFRFGGNRGIRDDIAPDQRAIALQVKEESSAVAYFVRPGDVVDVWINDGGGMQNIIPSTIVKAVGDATLIASDSGGRDFQYRTVTVVISKDAVKDVLSKIELAKGGVILALVGSAH